MVYWPNSIIDAKLCFTEQIGNLILTDFFRIVPLNDLHYAMLCIYVCLCHGDTTPFSSPVSGFFPTHICLQPADVVINTFLCGVNFVR